MSLSLAVVKYKGWTNQGRIGLGNDVLALEVGEQRLGPLVDVRVEEDLVDDGRVLGLGEKDLDVRDAKVGNSDGLDETGVLCRPRMRLQPSVIRSLQVGAKS